MLKKFSKAAFAVLLILVSASLIIEMKYSISFSEYLAYSVPLTREEHLYLKEKGRLIYGVDPENAPFSEIPQGSGQAEGLILDYISILSVNLSTPIIEKSVPTPEQTEALKDETIDVSDLFRDTDANNRYVSTQPIYQLEGILVTRYDNKDLNSFSDFRGRKLALIRDTYSEKKILDDFPDNQPMNLLYVDSIKDGLQLLMDGRVDGVAGNEITIDHYAEELGIKDNLRQIGEKLYKEDVALAVNIYDTKLYNILNKAILKLKKEDAFSEVQSKWLGNWASMRANATSVRLAQWIIIFCVALVELLMIWESVLNRRIDQKTHELQIEKNNLQVIIDNINALVAVISGEDIITHCNARGREMLGDPDGSFLGCGLGTVDFLQQLYTMHLAEPEHPYYQLDSHYYSVSLLFLNQKKQNRLLLIEDCTQKTLTEKKMRQENKMAAVGQLSAGLAHEIRNPLGLIKNYSYILHDLAEEYQREQAAATDCTQSCENRNGQQTQCLHLPVAEDLEMFDHALDVIDDSTRRIDNLVENLLSFSRLSNDKPSSFNIEKILQSIISLEEKKLEKSHTKLNLSCPKGLTVCTREETIKITAFNLINNAAEAFAQTEQTNCRLDILIRAEDGILTMEVTDNGPGMSEDTLENIFNPFFTTKDTGTGLGLYIVSSELEKVNGQITATSKQGEGTRFTVTVPLEQST